MKKHEHITDLENMLEEQRIRKSIVDSNTAFIEFVNPPSLEQIARDIGDGYTQEDLEIEEKFSNNDWFLVIYFSGCIIAAIYFTVKIVQIFI